jgi:hypothetical protein
MLVRAVTDGGQISRRLIAKCLDKHETDTMRGIGKPFHTALRRLTEEADLDIELPVPLAADYETGGWMTRFVMPPSLLALFTDAVDRARAEDEDADADADADDTPSNEG